MHLSLLRVAAAGAALVVAQAASSAPPPVVPSAPPQNRGLPYTDSGDAAAMSAIRDGIAVFAGSRYGYVEGVRVRLSDTDLLHAEAVEQEGVIYVPAEFAAVAMLPAIHPPAIPSDLAPIADRWVYAPHELLKGGTSADVASMAGIRSATVRGERWVALADVARAKGFQVTQLPCGLLYAGSHRLTIGARATTLLDCIVTLFDTPEKLADPDIATRAIPTLARQGKWTDHVKVTPEQQALLNGPETVWPTAQKSAYDYAGFNVSLLGSKVPPPGVYPRLLFSPDDVPALAARVKSTRVGQMALIEMEHLFRQSWWDPKTSDGRVFQKLASGDLAGLEWDAPPGTPPSGIPHVFKGQKPGIFNTHVAYDPECLTAMALYCLITGDDAHGRQAAAAIANYYRLREPLVDEWLRVSDSEFGTSYRRPDGSLAVMDGNGARTHWRNIHGVIANMNLGLALDLAGKWMSAADKDAMRRIIAKATYGRRSYAQDAPVRFRDVNWMAWDLPQFLAVAAIEGLPGFDPEVYASGQESIRAFCDWGIDDSGVIYESNGKTAGSLQFLTLSMVALARRGENLFGHPHWRKLLAGQIQMTSPDGRVTVNSGTQYTPYSRQALSLTLVTELKGFFPESRQPDYLVTKAITQPGAADDEYLREWPRADFDPAAFRREVGNRKRLRLPSLTYPGFVHGVLYDADTQPTTRADLHLPLDFSAPMHGVFSSYSDATPDAVWMNLLVRPDHYLGAGHHHADAGMFHFSALGVDWFTQSPFDQQYDGKYYNLVQVDGASEPTSTAGILGYNGAATYLGATTSAEASVGSADLTYAYSWRWLTQPPQVWSPELQAMGWEMDPSPAIARIFAGTARYKLRPWWPTYTQSNYIATSRAPFNPMQYVFRSAGVVRGTHAYGFVVDDLKKDGAAHLYQWAAMLNGGVWQAGVPGLPSNEIALGYTARDPDVAQRAAPPMLHPKPGDPLLLVCALGMAESGDGDSPLVQVERAAGPVGRNGKPEYYDRLVINQRAPAVAYRVLLLPVRAGEQMPVVTYDAATSTAVVGWPGQSDTLTFETAADHRTHLLIRRGGHILLQTSQHP